MRRITNAKGGYGPRPHFVAYPSNHNRPQIDVGCTFKNSIQTGETLRAETPEFLPAIPPEAIYPAQPELEALLQCYRLRREVKKKGSCEAESQQEPR